MMNMSRGELAYTMLDLNDQAPAAALQRLRAIEGILRVRDLGGLPSSLWEGASEVLARQSLR